MLISQKRQAPIKAVRIANLPDSLPDVIGPFGIVTAESASLVFSHTPDWLLSKLPPRAAVSDVVNIVPPPRTLSQVGSWFADNGIPFYGDVPFCAKTPNRGHWCTWREVRLHVGDYLALSSVGNLELHSARFWAESIPLYASQGLPQEDFLKALRGTAAAFDLSAIMHAFNALYDMPLADPTDESRAVRRDALRARLKDFMNILEEEGTEADAVYARLDANSPLPEGETFASSLLKDKLFAADLFGDIAVYALSELVRWGFDPATILTGIMAANFTKLNPDGTPTYDERGKLQKGPNTLKAEVLLEWLHGVNDAPVAVDGGAS